VSPSGRALSQMFHSVRLREVGEQDWEDLLFFDLSTEREHGFGQVGVPGSLDGATA
jgi:hypothetical protein